ncbi:hypothetical protein K491DRAFT_691024 [Lophiostoma macrostomum CBS 122681]|uniref:Uncharacterized protein n=1 Tax=Lophiostoma macrostomum CBS 122681 TaxID=1314788 RepID=A0A6A6TD31_9PLEO|nr:hypothetical protein K491DRAFT_691024 [Lophiostoma macrostomum CBS 122681]
MRAIRVPLWKSELAGQRVPLCQCDLVISPPLSDYIIFPLGVGTRESCEDPTREGPRERVCFILLLHDFGWQDLIVCSISQSLIKAYQIFNVLFHFVGATTIIVATELAIRWNNISGVNSLWSAGQVIPLGTGLGCFARVVYLIIREYHRDKTFGGIHEESISSARVSEHQPAAMNNITATSSSLPSVLADHFLTPTSSSTTQSPPEHPTTPSATESGHSRVALSSSPARLWAPPILSAASLSSPISDEETPGIAMEDQNLSQPTASIQEEQESHSMATEGSSDRDLRDSSSEERSQRRSAWYACDIRASRERSPVSETVARAIGEHMAQIARDCGLSDSIESGPSVQ